jgi:arylsulfatase A-like enzyme
VANGAIERPGLFLTGKEPELDDDMRRRAIAAHNACVSFVDAQVGVVLEAMDRLKLWDSTVVVLLGDHGFHLGEHRGLWRKDTLFEEALRTPLIVAGPAVGKPGAPTRAIVELMDVYPTLIELARLRRPPGIQGTSLVPLLKDPEAKGRDAAFSFRRCYPPQLGRSMRTERYRFTEWPDGSQELYDLSADPRELTNLARSPEQGATVAEMRKRLYEGYAAALADPTASADADR